MSTNEIPQHIQPILGQSVGQHFLVKCLKKRFETKRLFRQKKNVIVLEYLPSSG